MDESDVSEDSDEETFVDKDPPKAAVAPKQASKQVRKDRESTKTHEKPIKPSEVTARPFKSVADLVDEQQRELEKENALQLMNAIKVVSRRSALLETSVIINANHFSGIILY